MAAKHPIVAELETARLPVYVVDQQPISTGHATTEELLREREVIAWRRAKAEAEYGTDSQGAEIIAYLVADEWESITRELLIRTRAASMPSAPPWPNDPPDTRAEWDEVKRRTDIVELAERLIGGGKPSGGLVWYRCFAHEDDTPSLAVYPSDQHFHCFSCGMHGDVIDLARHALRLTSFQATMAVLAEWAGVTSRTVAIVKDGETVEVKPE